MQVVVKTYLLSAFSANQIYMVSSGIIFRRQAWLAVVLGFSMLSEAHATFGGLVPLAYSGQVAYNYNYVENAGSQSEATSLLFGLGASGYVWRPWFATTSLALNVGLSNTNSTSSSTEGTVGTGSFSMGLFPRSRFPFSLIYSRTDSRSQQFQDISQISGSTSFRVTRWTLRQSYRPRAYNQMYNGWYSYTEYDGDSFGSDSTVYGLDYQLRISQQILSVNIAHTSTQSQGVDESSVDVVSLAHVYTPSAELGVSSLVSYVESDPGGRSSTSTDFQAFSSFFWRPEYRAVRVSGGVRLSESKSDGVSATTISRSLSTNLGLGYRISRSLNMNAGVSLSTSDNESTQTLSTAQTMSLSYTGAHKQWSGYSYAWQWNASASNITTQTEIAGVGSTDSTDRQNVSSGIGHNLSKSWALSPASSLAATFSQSVSGSKNSEVDSVARSLNQGAGLSWSSRGGRGSTYVSGRFNDSRSFGDTESVFDSFSLNYNTDITLGRLSSMSGNANYQMTQSETKDAVGDEAESLSRNLSGGVSYRNNRPFGIYNLLFTSSLQGGKQIGSVTPTSTLRWQGTFSYSLGLLSTSLGFRASESAGGNITKSMNFQATRAF